MTYDEQLADRVRAEIGDLPALTERRMFGGLAFLVHGNLALAANREGALMVRCDRDEADAIVDSGAAEFVVMRGRPMRGWLSVAVDQMGTKEHLARWVDLAVAYATSLPPK